MNSNEPPSAHLFGAFDPAQLGGLTGGQRDMIARAVVAQGPALIREGHAQRVLGRVGLGGALAAAAALLLILRSDNTKTSEEGAVIKPEATTATLVTPRPAARCASDAPATPIEQQQAGRNTVQIGSRISAVLEGAKFSIMAAEPCMTHLALMEGTLTVKADDLGGGSLVLDTPHGQVRTGGTSLRVVTLASSTTIGVAEGEVVMSRGLPETETVTAGRAVELREGRVERHALSDEERSRVLQAFEPQPPSPTEELSVLEPTKTKSAVKVRHPRRHKAAHAARARAQKEAADPNLLAQAEALWRTGARDAARKAFRSAGEQDGATGEAAWLRLARLELQAGSADGALRALKGRRSHTGKGVLEAEALWLQAQAFERAGKHLEAVRSAEQLIGAHPSSPQAHAARRLVAEQPVQ